MRLSALALRRFRNLGHQDLEIPPEGVALIGDNAQGKSNFLEAIYYLETFRSFRGARDEQLVGFGEDLFRVVGTTSDGAGAKERAGTEVAAAFERKSKRKKVSVGGAEPPRLGDALGRLAAVIFSPADVELVSGGPRERRRYLDIVLSLNEPGYLESLQEYRRVLGQRNASLRRQDPAALVAVWDSGLARAGAEVVAARRRWVEEGERSFAAYYGRVCNEARARMTYCSSVPLGGADSVEDVRAAFAEALAAGLERDRRWGVTGVGPHRDDVRLELEEREGESLDLREYGSGGQKRTAALALRLVEAETIRGRRGERPLILLDDVFAELDAGRSERVMAVLEEEDAGQVVLTAPKEADVRIRRDRLARWRIAGGRVST